jgi:hypothetical protein
MADFHVCPHSWRRADHLSENAVDSGAILLAAVQHISNRGSLLALKA